MIPSKYSFSIADTDIFNPLGELTLGRAVIWNVNVSVFNALWVNFLCLNLIQAINQIDMLVNTKKVQTFVIVKFEVYIFI